MAKLIDEGDAIEGDVVEGHSRKPLQAMGLHQGAAGRFYRFVAKFNVHAVVTATAGQNVFFPNASNALTDEIVAETAVIHSHDRQPACQLVNATAAHRANSWRFTKRTGAKITAPFELIVNARRARLPAR